MAPLIMSTSGAMTSEEPASAAALTAAQRARAERNRQRARALQQARLVSKDHRQIDKQAGPRVTDTGGGFLLEEDDAAGAGAAGPAILAAPHAPLVHASEQPHCLECARPFPQSYLFDAFDYSVCDGCRDDEGAHALLPRTEAKAEFLLKDCDLDSRPPALRCVRRRNPHRSGGADMRLYLRAQVCERAEQVWGGAAALAGERARRAARAARGRRAAHERRLRALRLQVRAGAPPGPAPPHRHRWAAERALPDPDTFERECLDCGHLETYEKM